MFLLNSLLRTGKVENNFSTVTVVPTCRAAFLSLATTPECSNSKCVPMGSSLVLVSTVSFPSAHNELSASPRNPNVSTDPRSEKSDILEVWCLRASAYRSARGMISDGQFVTMPNRQGNGGELMAPPIEGSFASPGSWRARCRSRCRRP